MQIIKRVIKTSGGKDSTGEAIPGNETYTEVEGTFWPSTTNEGQEVGVVNYEEVHILWLPFGSIVEVGDEFLINGNRFRAVSRGFAHVNAISGRSPAVTCKILYVEPRSGS